jgi:tetratricopeptide (TPR) repeat protein
MADADESIKQGDFNVAAATLERAVRISPREAEVFNQLAYVRFKQKKWELAEHLAKKSALLDLVNIPTSDFINTKQFESFINCLLNTINNSSPIQHKFSSLQLNIFLLLT